jgi:hypothetical protein
MKPIDFPEKNQDIGAGQDKYVVLPAKIITDQVVPIWSAWKPSEDELKKLNKGDAIWVRQVTGGAPFQPIELTIERPDFDKLDKEAEVEMDKLIQELNEKYKRGEIDLSKDQARQLREKIKGKSQGFKKGEKHLKVEKGGQSGSK